MALQSTNRVKIAKARETTFGVIPTDPVFKGIRETSSSLASNPQTITSNEIRSDRQVTDLILTGFQAGGDVAGEVSYGAIDDDLEEALQGTWSLTPARDNAGTADSVITAVATSGETVTHATGTSFVAKQLVLFSGFGVAGNNGVFACTTGGATSSSYVGAGLTDEAGPAAAASMKVVGFRAASGDIAISDDTITSTSLDFTTLGLVPGRWLRLAGFATSADNDFVRLAAVATHTLTLDRMPSGWADDAGTSVVISVYLGDVLVNGSTLRTSTIERQYLDQSPVTYEYLRGQALGTLVLNIASGAIATYTKTYVGSDAVVQTTRESGSSDVAAPTNSVLNAASNVGRLGFDGTPLIGPNFVKTAAITVNNNLRRQDAVGHLGSVGIGNGEFNVTGQLDTYFGDKTLLDKITNNTLTSFDFRLGRQDGNKQAILFDFPSIKLSGGSPAVSGKNADVMVSATFQAIMDATLGYTVSAQRFTYLP